MNKYVNYTHGETGLELAVIADFDRSGDVELKKVIHKGENILPLLGEDIVIDIELFIQSYLEFTVEQ